MSEAALEVLDVLADGAVHSGEALALRFGISRAAIAKRIEQLRGWGLDVGAQAGTGYQLPMPLERLDADRISKALSSAHRKLSIEVLTEVDSTNTRLMTADAGDDPQVLLAERQTAGRGRRGREWVSPFGSNLYCSLAYSFASWPPQLTTLPLAMAVALARAVEVAGLAEARIKWPNDLHVDGAKLAGILMETRGEAGGPCRVVIGVGLNLALSATQAAAVTQPWTSLGAALATRVRAMPGRNAIAALLIDALLDALSHFQDHGFAPFAAEWQRRDLLLGEAVQIEGDLAIQGVARGVDADGGLILQTAAGRRVVHAGDVSVRRT